MSFWVSQGRGDTLAVTLDPRGGGCLSGGLLCSLLSVHRGQTEESEGDRLCPLRRTQNAPTRRSRRIANSSRVFRTTDTRQAESWVSDPLESATPPPYARRSLGSLYTGFCSCDGRRKPDRHREKAALRFTSEYGRSVNYPQKRETPRAGPVRER